MMLSSAEAEKRLRPYVWAGLGVLLAGVGLTVWGAVGAGKPGIEVLALSLSVIGAVGFVLNLLAIAWIRRR